VTLWTLVAGMAVITYALRLSVIGLFGRLSMPKTVVRALRFVPPAVLSAIILPELLRPHGTLDLSAGNARLVAGILAALIARLTGNAVVTIGAGMAALWILQALTR
jgi:branched-subunit amino acid transport protein